MPRIATTGDKILKKSYNWWYKKRITISFLSIFTFYLWINTKYNLPVSAASSVHVPRVNGRFVPEIWLYVFVIVMFMPFLSLEPRDSLQMGIKSVIGMKGQG